jgi:uncharacterized protein (DUF2141 family)
MLKHRTILPLVVALVVSSACAAPPAPQKKSDHAAPARSPAPATDPVATARLTITVKDIRNRKGQLIFGVFKSADGFPTVERKSVNWQVKDVTDKTVTFTADLPPGKYGASVLHDENRSGDMDKNVAGIPKEGYGVTNNPKPAFRAATFKEATFTLPPEGASLTISVQYF